jgi:hypothetical protein
MAHFALCIGINDYPGTGNDLSGCVNDALDWAATFKKKGFAVGTLLDRKATGKGIRDGIREALKKAGPNDTVVIAYSGHGSQVPDKNGDEPDGTDECICPHDTFTKGVITDDELYELYCSGHPGTKIIMISDSCNSGTVTRFVPITTPPTIRGGHAPQRRVRFLPPGAFLSQRNLAQFGVRRSLRRSSPPGRGGALLMAGCQDSETSSDAFFNGRPNGAFTFVALDVLKSLPKNATYQDWMRKILTKLPTQQYPQTPNLYGSTSMKKWKVLS